MDINPEAAKNAGGEVTYIQSSATDIAKKIESESVDIVFTSNFFEHLKSKEELVEVIQEMSKILKSGGRALVIQPNYKYAFRKYWDFLDHRIPLTEKSLGEAFLLNNFRIVKCFPRFLPFTTKGRLSKFTFLLKIYLRIPLLWKIFGKQAFLVAEKLI